MKQNKKHISMRKTHVIFLIDRPVNVDMIVWTINAYDENKWFIYAIEKAKDDYIARQKCNYKCLKIS